MKKYIMVSMLLVGCAHNSNAVIVKQDLQEKVIVKGHDAFDTVGEEGATCGRWAYNKTLQAYEWVTSEENKARYQKVWEATKEEAKKIYDKAQEEYKTHK